MCAVIPTKNRATDLSICIESLLQQDPPPAQVVIIDQSCSNESQIALQRELERCPLTVRASLDVHYERDPSIAGLTAARNRALEFVKMEVVLFLDDDVRLEPHFIERIVDTYRTDPSVTGVSGIVTNYQRPPLFFRLWNAVFVRGPFHDDRQPVYWNAQHLLDVPSFRVSRLGGGLMSFRMAGIRNVHFDEALRGVADGEDVDFCLTLGREAVLVVVPGARLEHRQSPVGRLTDHWLRRSARATHFLYRKHWRHGIKNRVSFLWLQAGYALVAAISTLRQRSFSPWHALRTGIREGSGKPLS